MNENIKRKITFVGSIIIVIGFLLHLAGVFPIGIKDLVLKILLTFGIIVFSIPRVDDVMESFKCGEKDIRTIIMLLMYFICLIVIWLPFVF